MAKKPQAKQSKTTTYRDIGLPGATARKLGVHENTFASAVKAGHIETVSLGCGSKGIVIASAKAWAKSERKRGPKKK